ncbi:LysE family translocator [Herbaspirillum sp. alder98]|uniref:LysE family translocator n=1 Tax=Herbaspirillum sp. alder98 TaxID=2913096 RepID=UPI001CD857B4|nr:LysE family translocator [Herbaspirillum sp. alder98]MCA1325063.1 LysE family translocator [Herbaspirillum sp. alder98]
MTFDSPFLIFLLSVALILITPGPTNTLLAVAGLGLGWRRALPLLLFEFAGYFISISVWGLLLAPLQAQHPWVATLVRIASACYLAYTAVKVWRDARLLHSGQQRTITPRMLLMATLLNPKGLLFALVIFPPHAFETPHLYAVSMTSFTLLLVPIGTLWISLGHALGHERLRFVSPRKVQRLGSVAIAMFSVFIAWAAFR